MIRARLAILLVVALTAAGGPRARGEAPSSNEIEQGRYLATVGDCIACHTAPGGKPFAGGKVIETPFGSLVSRNITPDRETGIGAWTDDTFDRAMRNGVGPLGKHYYPAFPYPFFTRMTRDDVSLIRRYLATLDPVRHFVQSNLLPFPFRIRAVMIAWNGAFFKPGTYQADPARTAQWNRGAYLVQGAAHCGACHTAKNVLGADKTGRAYEGEKLQGWFAPDLTNDERGGLASWTEDDIVEYLRSGRNRTAAATGPMAEVIALSTSNLRPEDLRAIAVYLKDLPRGREKPAPAAPDGAVMTAGKEIFLAQCGACHQPSGVGVTGLFPALAKAPDVRSDDFTDMLRIVLRGGKSVATDKRPTGAGMPSFGWKLSDRQIAEVTTYIRNEWGNAAPAISAGDVAAARRDVAREGD